jgi:hypothetical protein
LLTTFLPITLPPEVLALLIALRANAVRCESHSPVAPTAKTVAKVSTSGEIVTIVMTSTKPHVPSMKTKDCLMHLGQRPRLAFSAADIFSIMVMIQYLRRQLRYIGIPVVFLFGLLGLT